MKRVHTSIVLMTASFLMIAIAPDALALPPSQSFTNYWWRFDSSVVDERAFVQMHLRMAAAHEGEDTMTGQIELQQGKKAERYQSVPRTADIALSDADADGTTGLIDASSTFSNTSSSSEVRVRITPIAEIDSDGTYRVNVVFPNFNETVDVEVDFRDGSPS
jgi:hypothetical protein